MEKKLFSDYSDREVMYNHLTFIEPDAEQFVVHSHDVWEIIYLRSGNISGVIGAKTYKLHKNSLIIFRPYTPHCITVNGTADYERYDIIFDDKALAKNICKKIPNNLEVIDFNANRYVADVFSKLDYYYENLAPEAYKVVLVNAVEEIILNLSIASDENYNGGLTELNPVVRRALDYIERNYTRTMNVADICEELFITKSHLHHLFVEHLGVSPKRYINTRRLTRAQKLIRMGERPNEVYSACGFADYATFFRNYKTLFGHTPKEEKDIEIERTINS